MTATTTMSEGVNSSITPRSRRWLVIVFILCVMAFVGYGLFVAIRHRLERPQPTPLPPAVLPDAALDPDGTGDSPRIAALSPAVAVVLRDMGREKQIVARHGYDLILPRSIPVAGDQAGLDYEALLAARPTHVITQWGSRELPPRLTALAQRQGWRLLDVRLLTLADVRESIERMSDVLNAPGQPDAQPDAQTAALLKQFDEAFAEPKDPAFATLGPVLMLVSTSPPAALGPGSVHHEILTGLGATPALSRGNPFVELDAEDVLSLRPGVIVLVMPRSTPLGLDAAAPAPPRRSPNEALGRLAELNLPATAEGRVVLLDDPLSLIPSTAMLAFRSQLREALRACLASRPDEAAQAETQAPSASAASGPVRSAP